MGARITITDLHWTAGFLEGRGNFSVDFAGGRSIKMRLKLRVRNKIVMPLERLQQLYGGTVFWSRHDNAHEYRLLGPKAVAMAREIAPLLSDKRRQRIEDMMKSMEIEQ